MEVPGRPAAHAWARRRVDRSVVDAADALLADLATHLAVATGDAVTVRALSADGRLLLPLAAHDADPDRCAAIAEIMTITASTDGGMWRPLVDTRRPLRWRTPPGSPPGEASRRQRDFLQSYPVRAVLGVPLLVGDELVGGISLVRFSVDKPFTDDDENLVVDCAVEIAAVVRLRSRSLARVADIG